MESDFLKYYFFLQAQTLHKKSLPGLHNFNRIKLLYYRITGECVRHDIPIQWSFTNFSGIRFLHLLLFSFFSDKARLTHYQSTSWSRPKNRCF